MKWLIAILCINCSLVSPAQTRSGWERENDRGYELYYTSSEKSWLPEYKRSIDLGISSVEKFFRSSYPQSFEVYVYPNRNTIDSAWQKDWHLPDLKSECWMVASGVARKIDIISPRQWNQEACEHAYEDKIAMQQLITHELFHVYHGQLNASHDFSDVENIDWFVEGLATYASGQCSRQRIDEVKKGLLEKSLPAGLDQFWTGKIKYGLSGTVVMYLDEKYGRDKIKELLVFNKKSQILSSLGISESFLLDRWKDYMNSL